MKNTTGNAQKILSKHCGLNDETSTGMSVLSAMVEYAEKIDNNCVAPPVSVSLPDIRNKLSPIKNLIAMLENFLMKGSIEGHSYIQKEIEQCKESIAYLSGNGR